MNRFTPLPFIILTLILAVSSCTIEKRTFNRGYHVSWNMSLRNATTVEANDQLAKEEVQSVQEPEHKELLTEAPVAEQQEMTSTDQPVNSDQSQEIGLGEQLMVEQILAENPTAITDTVVIDPTFEQNGVGSFVIGVLSGLSFLGVTFGFPGVLLLLIPLTIVGVILGIRSVVRYRRSPILYRTNVFGILGLILNSLALIFTIYIITVLIIFFAAF